MSTAHIEELFSFFRDLVLRHEALSTAPAAASMSVGVEVDELVQGLSDRIRKEDWLSRAMLRVFECRRCGRAFPPNEAGSVLKLIERTLRASGARFRSATDGGPPGRPIAELTLVLPLPALVALVASMLPDEAVTQVERGRATISYRVSPDGVGRRAGKMAAGLLLGGMVGGYWGAILGGDSASRGIIRKGGRIKVSAQEKGELVTVAIKGEPRELGDAFRKAILAAEQRACMLFVLGLGPWPPSDPEAVVTSDKEIAKEVSRLLGSGDQAGGLLGSLGIRG